MLMKDADHSEANPQTSKLADWVPMPRYLLRSWVVKRLIRQLHPKTFVEIGAASGHMAQWMSDQRQMSGTAVEISNDALEMMQERLASNDRVPFSIKIPET